MNRERFSDWWYWWRPRRFMENWIGLFVWWLRIYWQVLDLWWFELRKRTEIKSAVSYSLLPFWLGVSIEEYGCPGLGHRGLAFCLELGFIEFMLTVGKRYEE